MKKDQYQQNLFGLEQSLSTKKIILGPLVRRFTINDLSGTRKSSTQATKPIFEKFR